MKPMTSLVKVALLATLYAASIHSSPATDDPCLNRTIAANVQTEELRFVKGLTSPNFRGKIHGKPVQIVSVSYDTAPRRIVILLDASGSMFEYWPIEIMVSKSLVASMSTENLYALLTFSNGVEDKVDFSQGAKAVVDRLTTLEAKDWTLHKGEHRKTALLDALVTALDFLRPARVGDAIYLITDGNDNASRTRPSEIEALLLTSGVRLFGLITTENVAPRERIPQAEVTARFLEALIQATGGDSLTFSPGLEPLPNSYSRGGVLTRYAPRPFQITDRDRAVMSFAATGLGREISEFYRLQVKLAEPADKSRDWKLEVMDPGTKKQPHLRVIYPHKLAGCQ